MASAVGLFATGATVGYFAHYARSTWWPRGEVVLSDSEEELEDDDGHEDEENTPARATEECKMVLGVRTDLKMDKGKIAAQCGVSPCEADYTPLRANLAAFGVPNEDGLQSLAEAAKSLGVAARVIQDAGRTQVEPGSRTVIGLGPAPISVMDQLTRQFKLL